MKRNLIPLLGVAFVVAIASTGIFYGLFVGKLKSAPQETAANVVVAANALKEGVTISRADVDVVQWQGQDPPQGAYSNPDQVVGQTVFQAVDKGQPIVVSKVVTKAGGGIGVPDGMRAISVHVSDSSGLIGVLRPGHRVDVQVFNARSTEPQARTILESLTVLSVSPQMDGSSQGGFSAPVVTLVASPQDADLLGFADSFARIRLILRNPLDGSRGQHPALQLSELFHRTAVRVPSVQVGFTPRANDNPDTERLRVEVVGIRTEALAELAAKLGFQTREDGLQAAAIGSEANVQSSIEALEKTDQARVLAEKMVAAGPDHSSVFTAGGKEQGLGLRVRFTPSVEQGQTARLRVEPQITSPVSSGVVVRKLTTELQWKGTETLLFTGFADAREREWLFSRLAGGGSGGRQLILLVHRSSPATIARAVQKP